MYAESMRRRLIDLYPVRIAAIVMLVLLIPILVVAGNRIAGRSQRNLLENMRQQDREAAERFEQAKRASLEPQ